MKPCSFKTFNSSNHINSSFFSDFGSLNTVCSFKGSIKELGVNYRYSTVVLFNRLNHLPVGVKRPDVNGDFKFLGLNNEFIGFMVCENDNPDYNHLIFSNIVPK